MGKKQNMTNSEHFKLMSDVLDGQKVSYYERKICYLGMIARYIAVIADALEERKAGDTDEYSKLE